jgi:hypothetical protein
MLKSIDAIRAILPCTHFDWHMRGNYFVVMAAHKDLSKLRALYRIIDEHLKPILWQGEKNGDQPSISILGR